MKKRLPSVIFCCFVLFVPARAGSEIVDLLKELDRAISERPVHKAEKETKIRQLKQEMAQALSLDEQYHIAGDIIDQYMSFTCDSAEAYINKRLEIAGRLDSREYLQESKLQLSFVYSLSGLFTQALEILNTVRHDDLAAPHLRPLYCWTHIRYYENLVKYTDDPKLSVEYLSRKDMYRDTLIAILPRNTDIWRKEKAFMLQEKKDYGASYRILHEIYSRQDPSTHSFAMESMGMARLYHLMDSAHQEKKHLIVAAITDTKIAVKENEALLALALLVYKEGDINRAYDYVKVALEDANFYNSRFRNTIIARVLPVIENAYLYRIEQQKNNLRLFAILLSVFVMALVAALLLIYRQNRIVSKAKRNLRAMNGELIGLNRKLDEANLIKEEYIGYFMNQCAMYIDKMDNYRKLINRKVKARQIDELYSLTSSPQHIDKAVNELYNNFDNAFLKLYPDFVENVNGLLREGEWFKPKNGLNTELRILALMRLGITDTGQIAVFLRYSIQTIYNYKSKMRNKAKSTDTFEEKIKKIGVIPVQ